MNQVEQLPSREDHINEAIAAYIQAAEGGEPPGTDEWFRRYPDLADELAAFFVDRDQVERRIASFCGEAALPGAALTEAGAARGGGRMLGQYQLLEEIGRGGMGVVYRAMQVSLQRTVAVKTIRAGDWASAGDVARFHAEAEVVASLDHPSIVPIHEAGEEDGQHFFAMKLIEGPSLAEVLAAGHWPVGRAGQDRSARLLRTLAGAVHYAHQRGVLHRDLKPANVLLDAAGEPHITDFGLARRLEDDARRTASGAIVGTPAYMAPEQASGGRRLTTATDVYALGAILYELLTGRPPFQAGPMLETLLQVRTAEPDRPRALQPRLSRDLETICLKCLHKEPACRYSSAEALALDLDRWLTGEAILARPSGTWERAVKWGRRHPARAILAAALVVMVGLLLAFLSVRLDLAEAAGRAADERAESERRQAEQQRREKQLLTAHLALRSGMTELERGEIGAGLLWLVRGFEATPADEPELARSFRMLLGSWGRLVHPLENVFAVPPVVVALTELSPDGRILARGGSRAVAMCPSPDMPKHDSLELYDVSTGGRLGEPLTFPSAVKTVRFSPDSKRIGVELENGDPVYLDIATRKPASPWKLPASPDAPTPDGRVLAWSSDERTCLVADTLGKQVRLWGARTRRPLFTPITPGLCPTLGGLDATGERIVLAGTWPGLNAPVVGVWEARTGKQLRSLFIHPEEVTMARLVHQGRHLVTACADGYLRMWELDRGEPLDGPLQFHSRGGSRLIEAGESKDGQLLYLNGEQGIGQLLDLATGRQHGHRLHPGPGGLVGWDWLPDGRRLLACGGEDIRVCAVAPLQHGEVVPADQAPPRPRELYAEVELKYHGEARIRKPTTLDHPGGRKLLRIEGSVVRQLDRTTNKQVGATLSHSAEVSCVALSPDGARLASASGEEVCCWDLRTGKVVAGPHRLAQGTRFLSFSPDGLRVVLAAHVNDDLYDHAFLWEPASGRPPGEHFARVYPSSPLCFSPDGTRLLGHSNRDSVRSWDGRTGKPLAAPLEHGGQVDSCCFSPDGLAIATSGLETPRDPGRPTRGTGVVRLWDTGTGRPLGPPLRAETAGHALWFSADGRSLCLGTCYLVFHDNGSRTEWKVRRWPAPRPLQGEPERARLQVETMTGLALDAGGAVVRLDAKGWQERRDRLAKLH
jgi:WD40 repeat protein